MKKTFLSVFAIAIAGSFTACNNSDESTADNIDTLSATTVTETTVTQQYVDLGTGQPMDIRKDEKTGYMVNASSGEPVEFYVDVNTRDTFFGRTGTVVNNTLVKGEDSKYELDNAKAKWDGNELKIKYADGSKVKVDEDEYKYKSADGKTKVKVDGDEKKIKTPDVKIKTEDGETRVKNR